MTSFTYKAVSAQGRFVEGRLDATDKKAAVGKIEMMGLIPVTIAEPLKTFPETWSLARWQRVSSRDILFFTEELATLVHAGLPLDRSLSIAAQTNPKAALRLVIQNVLSQIKGGKSLADALAAHPKQFSKLYVNMVRAGEAGGVLDPILTRLVEFERSADELRGYLITSLIYPCLLATVGLVSTAVLLFFVIPKFAMIFEDAGATIPASTLVMLWLSDAARSYWWTFPLGLAATSIGFKAWLRTPNGSRTWDALRLRLPLLGPTILKIEIGRFSRTLGTLIGSAVPLIAGLRIVQEIVRNQIIAEAVAKIASGARRGEGVAKPMRDSGAFPDIAVHLVEVGEETGRLEAMLLQIADIFDKDVKTSVKSLTAIFEPVVILVMGVIVGSVVLSMLMAIFSINEIGF